MEAPSRQDHERRKEVAGENVLSYVAFQQADLGKEVRREH